MTNQKVNKNNDHIFLLVWGTLKEGAGNHFYLKRANARKLIENVFFKPMDMCGEVYEIHKSKMRPIDDFEEAFGYELLFDKETNYHYYKFTKSLSGWYNYYVHGGTHSEEDFNHMCFEAEEEKPESYGFTRKFNHGDEVVVNSVDDTQDQDYVGLSGIVGDYFPIQCPPNSIEDYHVEVNFGSHVSSFYENELRSSIVTEIRTSEKHTPSKDYQSFFRRIINALN